MGQHRVGDGNIILDVALEKQAELAGQHEAAGITIAYRLAWLGEAGRGGDIAARASRRRGRLRDTRRIGDVGGHGAAGDAADGRRRRGGQRRVARCRAIGMQDIGGDGEIGGVVQTAATARRHGFADLAEQRLSGAGAPGAHEGGARQRWRVGGPGKVGDMAVGAIVVIGLPPGFDLSLCERAGCLRAGVPEAIGSGKNDSGQCGGGEENIFRAHRDPQRAGVSSCGMNQ